MQQKLRRNLIANLRWHRRIGLSTVIMVLFLAVTGIALNHSPSLNLSNTILRHQGLMSWYGFEVPEPVGYDVNNQWLIHDGSNTLFLGNTPITTCQAPLKGGVQTQGLLIALCEDTLVILTTQGELVETWGAIDGLPATATALQADNDSLFINTDNQVLSLSIDSLATTAVTTGPAVWSQPSPLPESLVNQLQQGTEQPGISLETLILDLHSGRFFGQFGVWFVDLVGVLICVLSLTGLWAWFNRRKLGKLGE